MAQSVNALKLSLRIRVDTDGRICSMTTRAEPSEEKVHRFVDGIGQLATVARIDQRLDPEIRHDVVDDEIVPHLIVEGENQRHTLRRLVIRVSCEQPRCVGMAR